MQPRLASNTLPSISPSVDAGRLARPVFSDLVGSGSIARRLSSWHANLTKHVVGDGARLGSLRGVWRLRAKEPAVSLRDHGMSQHGIIWVIIFAVITMMFLHLPQMAARQDAVHNTYSALVEVDALAKQRFVEEIDGHDRLVQGAIRGVLLQLDPYSGYISPSELAAFERRTLGDYIGIGVEIGMSGRHVTVISPIDGGPADHAGVMPGDVILEIDNHETDDMSIVDVEELLVGRPGSDVQLRVRHETDPEPVTLTVTRGRVSLVTVRGVRRDSAGHWDYMIDPQRGFGYIRISNFLQTTMRDFDAALQQLLDRGARGLIVDLRFDPGGMMFAAIDMVDRFVDHGTILSTVNRRRAVQEYYATKRDTHLGIPLVVLINSGSASSSEIVAGSLQACGRARIVGERSFGKGSVQHLIYLQEKQGAVKLTTAYYRLPDGRIIHRTPNSVAEDTWGVIPDVEVVLTRDEVRQIQEFRRAVDRALWSIPEHATPAADRAQLVSDKAQGQALEIHRDRQLLEALFQLAGLLGTNASFRRKGFSDPPASTWANGHRG